MFFFFFFNWPEAINNNAAIAILHLTLNVNLSYIRCYLTLIMYVFYSITYIKEIFTWKYTCISSLFLIFPGFFFSVAWGKWTVQLNHINMLENKFGWKADCVMVISYSIIENEHEQPKLIENSSSVGNLVSYILNKNSAVPLNTSFSSIFKQIICITWCYTWS